MCPAPAPPCSSQHLPLLTGAVGCICRVRHCLARGLLFHFEHEGDLGRGRTKAAHRGLQQISNRTPQCYTAEVPYGDLRGEWHCDGTQAGCVVAPSASGLLGHTAEGCLRKWTASSFLLRWSVLPGLKLPSQKSHLWCPPQIGVKRLHPGPCEAACSVRNSWPLLVYMGKRSCAKPPYTEVIGSRCKAGSQAPLQVESSLSWHWHLWGK